MSIFQVDLTDNAAQIGYILHRGDAKDPGPDQFWVFGEYRLRGMAVAGRRS